MSKTFLVSESTLTDRYQTTVPDQVRKVLGLSKREKIRYTIKPNGEVLLSRVDQGDEDPVIKNFLSFLAQDMTDNPERLKVVGSDLPGQIESLVRDVDVDLDSPLPDEGE